MKPHFYMNHGYWVVRVCMGRECFSTWGSTPRTAWLRFLGLKGNR